MHPDSWRSMNRAAARQHLNVPFRFTFSTRSHSSSPSSTMGVTFWPSPALFTRMSSRPRVCTTSAKNASTAAVDVTSRRAAAAVSPSPARAPATASAFSRCRSAMITAAPLAARVSAMPRPSPCAAPVTTATCPESVCGDPAFGFKIPHYDRALQSTITHRAEVVEHTFASPADTIALVCAWRWTGEVVVLTGAVESTGPDKLTQSEFAGLDSSESGPRC